MKEHLYNELFERQGGMCAICGRELTDRYTSHIDRIVRGEDGGKYIFENCQLICVKCDWDKEGNAPNSPYPNLAALYRTYKHWQLERMRYKNMIRAATGDKAGCTKSPYIDGYSLSAWFDVLHHFEEKEEEYAKLIQKAVKGNILCELICMAPGGGPIIAAHIVSHFDFVLGHSISSMWKYFGYDPTESYNPGKGKSLKSPLFASLSIALIRHGGPYRGYYDELKAKDISHGGALCRLIKLWLAHCWERARTLGGLSVTKPYAIINLGHDHYKAAVDYGWPTNEELLELYQNPKEAA